MFSEKGNGAGQASTEQRFEQRAYSSFRRSAVPAMAEAAVAFPVPDALPEVLKVGFCWREYIFIIYIQYLLERITYVKQMH